MMRTLPFRHYDYALVALSGGPSSAAALNVTIARAALCLDRRPIVIGVHLVTPGGDPVPARQIADGAGVRLIEVPARRVPEITLLHYGGGVCTAVRQVSRETEHLKARRRTPFFLLVFGTTTATRGTPNWGFSPRASSEFSGRTWHWLPMLGGGDD
jgi:hypothetical protein